jgi:hypothetical protein
VRDVDHQLKSEVDRCAVTACLQLEAMEAATTLYYQLADQSRAAVLESRQLLAECHALLTGAPCRWDDALEASSVPARRRAVVRSD